MHIQQDISLRPYNTFGIPASAAFFTTFTSISGLYDIYDSKPAKTTPPVLVIGGGSNILFTRDYDGLVAKNDLRGIQVVKKDDDHIYVRAEAGENWHKFVLYCIENNFAGVENLSLIPGSVGASPMQNIGAYGVEIKDVFDHLEAYHIHDKKIETFSAADCAFGYRESVFKRKYKGEYVITSVTFRLNKQPVFNTEYGAIQQELDKMGVSELSIKAISQAVVNIRQSKLPNPAEIGNAGSFFKNPTIPLVQFEELKKQFPEIVGYPADNQKVKVAAGWLIERCGWKGYRKGDAGCHTKQALVLVNYGKAQGNEIYDLSTEIMKSVETTFGIALEREVNVV